MSNRPRFTFSYFCVILFSSRFSHLSIHGIVSAASDKHVDGTKRQLRANMIPKPLFPDETESTTTIATSPLTAPLASEWLFDNRIDDSDEEQYIREDVNAGSYVPTAEGMRHYILELRVTDRRLQQHYTNKGEWVLETYVYDADMMDDILGLSPEQDVDLDSDASAFTVLESEGINHELSATLSSIREAANEFILAVSIQADNTQLLEAFELNPFVTSVQDDVPVHSLDHATEEVPSPRSLFEKTPYGIKTIQAKSFHDQNLPPKVRPTRTKTNRRNNSTETTPPSTAPTTTPTPITICIVDSGVRATHSDLPQNGGLTGISSVQGPWDVDSTGHGTTVAGILAAVGYNNKGSFGVIPDAGDTEGIRVFVTRALNDEGEGRMSHVLGCIAQCRAEGAQIVNMSLGCRGDACYVEGNDEI
eukprot:CAMPEP_0194439882 /NCGR_PEP_ID=MMETSP0176-20130528/113019_1 /TAXON_ID=216777 /ORGANISM="Proboscia alata, Strain PI-D3" /LENGTH=418 /DNA_ID=CAMNT_0039263573 /DNA_START=45 /DNA_END=1298 /DNA_ORIENTATION=-